MPRPLVIVESPAKAKTIARFLGGDYVVESSIGHIRDLPRGAEEVPAAYKGTAWARLGVNVDDDFKPLYVISREKKAQVQKLKQLLENASELYLATDEDREGESIAWHLREVLAPRVPVRRMVFHEITQSAIREAIETTREIDERLVDAQEARRILDRLYGYEVSPVLWKKVRQGLSAGRVQSVAIRMIVERERERMQFRSATWYSIEARYARAAPPAEEFPATLVTIDGRRVATGRDFDDLGQLKRAKEQLLLLGEVEARGVAASIENVQAAVASVEEKPFRRAPAAPFITSTLQQEAARKLRFSAQRTMQVAQRLYEQGYITYMRTDSTTLSDTALRAARQVVTARYGDEYLPPSPRRYERKVKNAQEAHEAVRPAGETFRSPEQVAAELSGDERRLYDLVWRRTIASQMNDARGVTAQVRLEATTALDSPVAPAGSRAELSASGRTITFPGFLRVYVEGEDERDDGEPMSDDEVRLPALTAGEAVDPRLIDVEEHATKPPPRYTEASLVKALEERGVGRPSTYASIIGTVQDRGYVRKRGTALVPTFIAFAVVGLLERHFGTLVDYGFTASMEDDLDEIASGREESIPWLRRFYFGADAPSPSGGTSPGETGRHGPLDGGRGLKESVSTHLDEIDAREVNSIVLGRDSEDREVVVRVGRYGPYLQRGDDRASLSDDVSPDELTVDRALELLGAPSGDRELGVDPATGKVVVARNGRFGPYVQLGDAGDGEKPLTASLFSSMTPEQVTLEDALRLLSLPRLLGKDAEGHEIHALNGRYGPYLRRGTDSRSLGSEDQLFTVTLDEALELFSRPKERRFGSAAAAPVREFGTDPSSGQPITLRQGRFGPYVTDGTVNASLRRADDPETLTHERAVELLADRRSAEPRPARGRRAGTAKKAGATKKAAGTTKKAAGVAKKVTGAAKKVTAAKKPAGVAEKVAGGAKKAPATRKVAGAAKKAPVTKRAASSRNAAGRDWEGAGE
jgi:DNA topoisomerase-1